MKPTDARNAAAQDNRTYGSNDHETRSEHTPGSVPRLMVSFVSRRYSGMTDFTQILSQIEQGDPAAAEQLLPLVHEELHKLAHHQEE